MSRIPCCLLLAATTLCIAAACRTDIVVHPPPPEDRYVSPFPAPIESFIEMKQPAAHRNIVSGVSDEVADGGRWTGRRAVLRFYCVPLDNARFRAWFVLPEPLMARAGRVILRVIIDGEPVQDVEYATPGPQEIEKEMTKGLTFDRETEVTLEMVVPSGRVPGPEIQYLLAAAGFRI